MSAVDRARAWLHGDADADPRQLVRDLLAAVEASQPTGDNAAHAKYLQGRLAQTSKRLNPKMHAALTAAIAALSQPKAEATARESELAQQNAKLLDAYTEAVIACHVTYQAVGVMLSDLGIFDTERGQNLLDNLLQTRAVHEVLPWPSVNPESGGQGDYVLVPREPKAQVEAMLGAAESDAVETLRYFAEVCKGHCPVGQWPGNKLVEAIHIVLRALDAALRTHPPASAAVTEGYRVPLRSLRPTYAERAAEALPASPPGCRWPTCDCVLDLSCSDLQAGAR